jgi:hypothetical protein
MYNQYFEFSPGAEPGQIAAGWHWNCGLHGATFSGWGTPLWPGGDGVDEIINDEDCTETEIFEGIWSQGTGLDMRSFEVHGDTLTATGDDGWFFTFDRQPGQ